MQDWHIYESDTHNAPIVFLLTGDEDVAKVWETAREMTARLFSLVTISVADWNHDL